MKRMQESENKPLNRRKSLLFVLLIAFAFTACENTEDDSCVDIHAQDACRAMLDTQIDWNLVTREDLLFPFCKSGVLYECIEEPEKCFPNQSRLVEIGSCIQLGEGGCYYCPEEKSCAYDLQQIDDEHRSFDLPTCFEGTQYDCRPSGDERCCNTGYELVSLGACDDPTLDGDLDDESGEELEQSETEGESEALENTDRDETELDFEGVPSIISRGCASMREPPLAPYVYVMPNPAYDVMIRLTGGFTYTGEPMMPPHPVIGLLFGVIDYGQDGERNRIEFLPREGGTLTYSLTTLDPPSDFFYFTPLTRGERCHDSDDYSGGYIIHVNGDEHYLPSCTRYDLMTKLSVPVTAIQDPTVTIHGSIYKPGETPEEDDPIGGLFVWTTVPDETGAPKVEGHIFQGEHSFHESPDIWQPTLYRTEGHTPFFHFSAINILEGCKSADGYVGRYEITVGDSLYWIEPF